jgi:hypothetical protein
MPQSRLVPCEVVTSGAALLTKMQEAAVHRITCDIDPYDDVAT